MDRELNAAAAVDVVVIGGGPGGSAAATMLARKGWQVLLLEREHFPRDHVGESLLPASIPVLEELGVLPEVEAQGFLRKGGATMVWGKDKTPWSWFFAETNRRYPHSYQVWRPLFDQLLLDNAARNGVDVRQGCQVTGVQFEDLGVKSTDNRHEPGGNDDSPDKRRSGSSGRRGGPESAVSEVRYFTDAGDERTVRAGFVVDASGQGALLGRQLGLRRWDESFRNLAVYAYYAGAKRLDPPADTNIFIESYPNGWLWTIPLHTGWASVGAVVDQKTGESLLREMGPARFLADQLAQAPHTAKLLETAQQVSGPFLVKDWSYACDEIAGDGYVLLGDAACFIDPLFSSGVHLALMSGVLAAAYVTTALRDPAMAAAAAAVYQELYYKEYHHFREMVRLFYSSNRTVDSYFWEARRILDSDGSDGSDGDGESEDSGAGLSPRRSFIQAVAGQPARGYERMVLERGRAPTQFADSVRAVEAERESRLARMEEYLPQTGGGAISINSSIYGAVPKLRAGARVERKPVIGDGEFNWGYALITEGHPEGLPCSGLVARLLSLMDGRTPVADLITQIAGAADEAPEEQRDQIAQLAGSILATLKILYVDGTIATLDEPAAG